MYRKYFKRVIDFIVGMIGFLVISPVFLILWLLLSFANKGAGAFFIQERPGRNERIFKVIKFKTMTDERDADGNLLPDVQRLTKIGKLVRSSSLDEIPQLINVLKGEMSLIGPRPLLEQYLPLYNDTQRRRHEVRPGITGWAQVNGRNALSWQQKFEMDVWYLDNISLLLDLRIFINTVKNVLQREGIYKDGDIGSMEAFNGKN